MSRLQNCIKNEYKIQKKDSLSHKPGESYWESREASMDARSGGESRAIAVSTVMRMFRILLQSDWLLSIGQMIV